jgi:hypothetical protein
MFTNKKSLLALSVASAIALSGCGSDNDANLPPEVVVPPVEVVVPPEAPVALGAVVNANLVDAETTDVVGGQVMFYENGVASTNVVDIDGNVITSLDATDGNFTFQLASGASVDEVTAVVTADGYVTKSYIIELDELSEGNVDAQLRLVSKTTAGVANIDVTETVSGGTSADGIVAGVADGKASASVTVDGGTTLRDANGDAITGSSVTLEVLTADTSSTAGAAITPEGLNAAGSSTVLTPVGVASVVMKDSNGVKVKSFSQPITVELAIPSSKNVATGDELTLVSQNEDTGVWTTETQKVTVGDLVAAENYYKASFQTDHLTTFAGVTGSDACASDFSISATGTAIPAGGLTVSVASETVNFTKKLKASTPIVVKQANLSKNGIAANTTANIEILDNSGYVWFETADEVSLCGSVPAVLAGPTVVSETLTLVAQCSNDDTATVGASGALVKYSLANRSKKVAKDEGEGAYALTNLRQDETYNVTVKYKGTLKDLGTKSYTITADGTDETFTESLECATTTGGTGGN